MLVPVLRRVFRRGRPPPRRADDDETSPAETLSLSPAGTFEHDDDDLDERYTCPICRELFVVPLYLHDKHAFCAKCLHEWVAWNSHIVSCPLCRKVASLAEALPALELVPPGHQVDWTSEEVKALVSAPRSSPRSGVTHYIQARTPRAHRPVRTGWHRFVTALTPSCISQSLAFDSREARCAAAARSLDLNDGRLIMYGVIHLADERNHNGRIYPANILHREVGKYDEHVREQGALGEYGHPSPTSPTFRSLDLDNVSHQILDYHWQGNLLMGHVEILDMEKGREVRDLIVAGNALGCASRGWATLREEDGFIWIQNDYELITFDIVDQAQWMLYPLRRQYRDLPPPIDVAQAYDSFSAHHPGIGAPPPPRDAGRSQ